MGSLYGNRNVLSGLASGLDTESMIENMVSGTKAKITSLQQKRTTWEWKQEAYRNIIDLMVDELNRRLEDKQLTVRLTDQAKTHVIDEAYDELGLTP